MTEATAPKRRLMDKNFVAAEFRYRRWSADLDETQTLEDALQEQFWSSAAEKVMGHDKLNPKGIGDIIEVRKRDTAMFAELIIVAIGPGYIRPALIRTFAPKDVSEAEDAPLTTKWNPGKRCHEVIRKADKAVMSSGHQTKDVAVAWITDHVAKMAA